MEVRLRVGPYRLGWVEVGLSRLVADLRKKKKKMLSGKSITAKQPGPSLNQCCLEVALIQRLPLMKVLLHLLIHTN